MGEGIDVEVARVVDGDALLEVLRERGVEAEPFEDGDRIGFRIPCGEEGADRVCDDVLAQVEALVADAGLPLVPQRGDGFIFLRPPGD